LRSLALDFCGAIVAPFGLTERRRNLTPFFKVLTQPEREYSLPPILSVPE